MKTRFFQSLFIILPLFFSAFLPLVHAQNKNELIKIGVRAHSGVEAALDKWSATALYLSQSIEGYQFEMIPLVGFDEMREAVQKKTIQLVLTNPAAYVELEHQYGVARIATLINGQGHFATKQFSAVLFTRADRTDIKDLSDIKGKSIMGVHQQAFGGWWMALGELKKHGISPSKDCTAILFGGKHEPVVFAIKEGKADVGTVRTGILEKMVEKGEINPAEFKIIGRINDPFFLAHSTQLYPEWPMARTAEAPDAVVKQVLASLMVMPPDSQAAIKGKYSGWTVPMGYNDVYRLMEDLGVGLYTNTGDRTLSDLINAYWQWVSFIVTLVLLSTLTALYIAWLHRNLKKSHDTLEKKVQERTLHLQEEIGSRKLAEEELHREKSNLQSILDSMDDGVYIVNSQYDIHYVNPVLVKDFGAYEGVKCYSYFHHRNEVCPWCKIEAVLAGKKVQWEWTCPKGKTYDLLDSPIMLPDGSTGKLEIFRDITERKEAEAELEKYQQHLETLVKEQTNTLEEKITELERMNELFVDREYRIKELRDKVEGKQS